MSIEPQIGTEGVTKARFRVPRSRFLEELLRHKGGAFGLIILGAFTIFAIFGRWIVPYDPNASDMSVLLSPPSAAHWFGTDVLGRDTFSRVIDGSRIAIGVAFISVSLGMVAGVVIGIVAGYFGGIVDSILNRSQDIIFAFPTLLLAIIMVAVLGPGLINASLAIAVVYSPRFARMARATALSVKSLEYFDAARLAGVSTPVILVRHMLPNVLPPVIVLAALSMSTAQLAYASLSFLGLGVNPPQADWGNMLSKARDFITVAPWLALGPATALVLLMLAFNVLGDAIRDVLDPRQPGSAKPSETL